MEATPVYCFGYTTTKILIRLKIMSPKYNTKENYQRLKKSAKNSILREVFE